MSQTLITKQTPLLSKGRLQTKGYATKMVFDYNRKCARGKLKEWDFYQILYGDKVLQFAIGHNGKCGQISAMLLDLDSGSRATVAKTFVRSRKIKRALDNNPEKPNVVQWLSKKLKVRIETTATSRRLTLSQLGKREVRSEIDITLTNCSAEKDKMVIATPFDKPKQWFLNYKENCFVANGYARIEGFELQIHYGNAVLDWERGVWPRHHQWIWGNGSTVVDGKHFGFNIGFGLGDTSAATENVFFWDNKAYKLGKVEGLSVGDNYRYVDEDKKFVFNVEPVYDNLFGTKIFRMRGSCRQIFGIWHGHIVLDDGKQIDIPAFIAFCEYALC